MIAPSSDVWFREDCETEWKRGRIARMQEIPRTKTDKSTKMLFAVEEQNEVGDLIGEMLEVISHLVDGSFEEFELVKLRNAVDDDPESCRGVEDLITLNHLHEPAILTCLQGRFESNLIYTNTGPILIAVVCLVCFALSLVHN